MISWMTKNSSEKILLEQNIFKNVQHVKLCQSNSFKIFVSQLFSFNEVETGVEAVGVTKDICRKRILKRSIYRDLIQLRLTKETYPKIHNQRDSPLESPKEIWPK